MTDPALSPAPLLVVVSGPAGTGKTTLAHRLARELGCPAICRDEIKEGLVFGRDEYEPALDDELTRRATETFFELLRVAVEHGVTVIAEAAFQRHVWAPNLEPLRARTALSVVQCVAEFATANERIRHRGATRRAHADHAVLERGDAYFTEFRRLDIDAPTITVDTTDAYVPPLDDVVRFVCGL